MIINVTPEELLTALMLFKSTAIPNTAYIDIRKDMDERNARKKEVSHLLDSLITSLKEDEEEEG